MLLVAYVVCICVAVLLCSVVDVRSVDPRRNGMPWVDYCVMHLLMTSICVVFCLFWPVMIGPLLRNEEAETLE